MKAAQFILLREQPGTNRGLGATIARNRLWLL